ncbi:MAG: helix-turn-helix transcriptional regulator [Alphaproteobacteria bacterium]|nr:helix-turn-helix transcriptional regulator [Alphaproteobacteria bacterium]
MRPTEEVTIVFKGLGNKPLTYALPRVVGEELHAYLVTRTKDSVPAEKVLPELADDTLRPAAMLRGLRYRENLTQKALADTLGIRQHHLSEMETGKRPIGKEMARKLAKILRTDWRIFL